MYAVHLQSSDAQKAQSSNSTKHSLSSRRPVSLNVVPSGTVASRVRLLESVPTTNYASPRRRTPTRIRGQLRSGYGSRLSSRFGKPASRNEHPDQEPRVDILHSYLGLNTARSYHVEEHAITDGGSDCRSTYNRANGINALVHPQDLTERIQYDALPPWASDTKNNAETSKTGQFGQRVDSLCEVDGIRNESFFKGRSLFPTVTARIGHSNMHSQGAKSRLDATVKSDMTVLTTSTVRRQSVRDLFSDYSIERPLGLVPDKLEQESGPKQKKAKIRCRNCHWYNSELSNLCVKCKFLFRTLTQKASQQTLISPKGEECYLEEFPDENRSSSPESSGKENVAAKHSKGQHILFTPGQDALQHPKAAPFQAKRPSTPTTTFSSFHMVQSPLKSQITSRQATLPQLPLPPHFLTGPRTTSIVQQSCFLIADRLSSGRFGNALPTPARMDGIYCRKVRSKSRLSQSHQDIECESVACRATHEDHEPYRHSVTCSLAKKCVREETDNGYVADTSVAEDFDQDSSSLQRKVLSQVDRKYDNWPAKVHVKLQQGEGSHQTLGSEYIECRGYPRTGHARHGSACSGQLGQCQHCIDDCQCTACQNTHHSVRCCMNEDHQVMVHHHHAPREVAAGIKALGCPTFLSQSASPDVICPSASHAPAINPLIASASKCIVSHPKVLKTTDLSQGQIGLSIQPPPKTTPSKPKPLLRSKQSILFKDKVTASKPPPWVSDPKVRTKSPATTAISSLRIERTTAGALLHVLAEPDSSPATCDKPSLDPNTEARKLSKTFPELFRFGEKNSVHWIKEMLLEHQEELRSIEGMCEAKLQSLSEESSKYCQNDQPNARDKRKQEVEKNGKTTEASCTLSEPAPSREHTLSEDDTVPTELNNAPVREYSLRTDETFPHYSEKPVKEHTLSADETVYGEGNEVRPPRWTNSSAIMAEKNEKTEAHDCVWRNKFLAWEQEKRVRSGENDIELKGLTVVVHMEGKEDLVIEADLRKGCEVRAGGH